MKIILEIETNSEMKTSENDTCRTIVSMLINQRKENLNLEQKLKDLQQIKSTTDLNSNHLEQNERIHSSTIKHSSLDEHQQRHFLYQPHFLSNIF